MKRTAFTFLVGILAFGPAFAQDSGNHDPAKHGTSGSPGSLSPYAGMQARPIKALSEEEIADLEAGRGMGLALVAELNGYPGPVHVIELASHLRLTDVQRSRAKEMLGRMKEEVVPMGRRVVALERELDSCSQGGGQTQAESRKQRTLLRQPRASCARRTCATTSRWGRSCLPRR
jgi:hypothetical protein